MPISRGRFFLASGSRSRNASGSSQIIQQPNRKTRFSTSKLDRHQIHGKLGSQKRNEIGETLHLVSSNCEWQPSENKTTHSCTTVEKDEKERTKSAALSPWCEVRITFHVNRGKIHLGSIQGIILQASASGAGVQVWFTYRALIQNTSKYQNTETTAFISFSLLFSQHRL